MKNLINIANGFKNLITNKNYNLMKERLAICEGCPVRGNTEWCKRDNGGCGCFLPAFTRNSNSKCIKGKW